MFLIIFPVFWVLIGIGIYYIVNSRNVGHFFPSASFENSKDWFFSNQRVFWEQLDHEPNELWVPQVVGLFIGAISFVLLIRILAVIYLSIQISRMLKRFPNHESEISKKKKLRETSFQTSYASTGDFAFSTNDE